MVNISKVKTELRKLKLNKLYTFELDLGRCRVIKVNLYPGSVLFDAYIRKIGYSFLSIYEKTTGFFISQFDITIERRR